MASNFLESFTSGRRERSAACLERGTRHLIEMASLELPATDEYRKTIEEMESDEEFWELEELEKELSKIMEDCEGEKSDTMDSQQQQAGQTGNVTIGRQSPAAPASTSVPVGNTFIFQQQVMSARTGKVDRVRFLVLLQGIRRQMVDACARLYSRNSMRLQVNFSQRLHISMKAISRLQPPSSRPFFTFFQSGTSDQDIILMETLPQVLCEASVHGQSKVVSMLLNLDTFSEFDLNIAASFAFLFGRNEVLQILEKHNVDVNEDKLLEELIDDHGGDYTQTVFSSFHCTAFFKSVLSGHVNNALQALSTMLDSGKNKLETRAALNDSNIPIYALLISLARGHVGVFTALLEHFYYGRQQRFIMETRIPLAGFLLSPLEALVMGGKPLVLVNLLCNIYSTEHPGEWSVNRLSPGLKTFTRFGTDAWSILLTILALAVDNPDSHLSLIQCLLMLVQAHMIDNPAIQVDVNQDNFTLTKRSLRDEISRQLLRAITCRHRKLVNLFFTIFPRKTLCLQFTQRVSIDLAVQEAGSIPILRAFILWCPRSVHGCTMITAEGSLWRAGHAMLIKAGATTALFGREGDREEQFKLSLAEKCCQRIRLELQHPVPASVSSLPVSDHLKRKIMLMDEGASVSKEVGATRR